MGLFSSGKSKSESWSGSGQKWATPFAKAAAGTVQGVYDANAGNLAQLSSAVSGLVPGLIDKFKAGNAGVDAAGGYVTDVLGGKHLNGNQHLQGMIDSTLGNVTSRVNANFGSRGSYGGTAHTTALGKALSEAELGLRYGNYSDEMGRMGQAAAMAPGIAQGEYTGLQEILGTAGMGAELPYTGVSALSNNLAALFSGGYNKSTQTGPGIGGQLLGSAMQAGAMAFSAIELKKDIEKVGEYEDGLGIYEWAYRNDPEARRYRGVMAHEVKELRPAAYIPNYRGTPYAGVNYAAL